LCPSSIPLRLLLSLSSFFFAAAVDAHCVCPRPEPFPSLPLFFLSSHFPSTEPLHIGCSCSCTIIVSSTSFEIRADSDFFFIHIDLGGLDELQLVTMKK